MLAVIYAGDVVFAVTGPLTAGKDCKDILGFSADRRHHRNWRRHHTRVAGTPFVIAVFMGVVTATGGGVIRGVLTQTRP